MANTAIIYTDGSAWPNPNGYGGWAFVHIDEDEQLVHVGSGNTNITTNNRMELTAVLEALTYCYYKEVEFVLYTDSMYVVNVFDKWGDWWVRKQKRRANMDIIVDIIDMKHKTTGEIKWIQAHNENEFNEMADDIANERRRELVKKYQYSKEIEI